MDSKTAAIQDGFGIYHHSFFVTSEGEWAVVQQGMRDHDGTARRYHWLGSGVSDFVNEPHAAIASDESGQPVLNMVAAESSPARDVSTEFARQEPRLIDKEIARVITMALPTRHWVDIKQDINPAHLRKVMLSTYEASPQNYEQLLAIRGRGGAVLLVSEDLDELMALCDRIAVVYHGRFAGEFKREDADVMEIGRLMAGAAK